MEPIKWQKYLLLVEFGLTEISDLERTIERRPWSERWELWEALNARLPDAAPMEFTVVKLVTPRSVGQLENVRLATRRDLTRLKRTLQAYHSGVSEVWACRTPIGAGQLSVAGRLAITTGLEPFGQCVEQVWQCSPRLLESRGPGFKYPYVRATRYEWGRSFSIAEVLLPRGWRRRGAAVRTEFAQSMIALERARPRLQEFSDFIESCGIKSYSFEYKIVGGLLAVIDWDTSNDWEILSHAASSGLLPVL